MQMCSHIQHTYRSVRVQREQIQPLFSPRRANSFICLRDILLQKRWEKRQKEAVRDQLDANDKSLIMQYDIGRNSEAVLFLLFQGVLMVWT